MPDKEKEALLRQQRKEALEELQKHLLTLGRLKTLIRDQHTYEVDALSESLDTIFKELSYTSRRMIARVNMIVVIRQGRLQYGIQPKQE